MLLQLIDKGFSPQLVKDWKDSELCLRNSQENKGVAEKTISINFTVIATNCAVDPRSHV